MQVDACSLAKNISSAVQHPLLDRVRQCSSNPEQAALFFQQIVNPMPHVRRQAIHHAWCAETVNRMFRQTRTDYPPDKVDPYYCFNFGRDPGCMGSACLDLLSCFSCEGCRRHSTFRSQHEQAEAVAKSEPQCTSKGLFAIMRPLIKRVKSAFLATKSAPADMSTSGSATALEVLLQFLQAAF